MPLAVAKKVGVVVGGVYYQGFLCQDLETVLATRQKFYWPWDVTAEKRAQILRKLPKLAKMAGGGLKELRALVLRFVLSDARVSTAVVGMRSPAEVEENLKVADQPPLSAKQIKEIIGLD